MKTLSSYVLGQWHTAEPSAGDDGFAILRNPSTEEPVARVSSEGIDFEAVVDHARNTGGPALRAMTFAQRGQLLKAMARALREHRDELLELSRDTTGTTAADGAFDVDGAGGTLAYYAMLGKRLGERRVLADDDGVQLGKTEGFWGRHVWVPRHGVAVAVNAFNFPAWGLFEKVACAILAGMPVIAKPATATAVVAHRAAEVVIEGCDLPDGALQLVVGGTGDLLDRLGPQDVFAFTGSADTASKLKDKENLKAANTRVNVEADSLNAAVLAPDLTPDADTTPAYKMFLKDVAREMTQKTGQKCTAVRRILVPRNAADRVQQDLVGRLGRVVVGYPGDESVTMGPVATRSQLEDTERGVAELLEEAVTVVCGGSRCTGAGAPEGKGYFFPPTLLRADEPDSACRVHVREIFGPVATILPYDGSAEAAGELVARAGGTLVTSVYTDDDAWLAEFVAAAGSTTGRIYVGSEEAAGAAFGSGVALPQSLHGGPGRAGGGEELGGMVGVQRYLQRVALQGARTQLESLDQTAEEAVGG
jgi:3,4-dehydroadipyl-CoA semialdehyde dehydrogenase